MGKYLDKTGLQYFYNKLKEKFADKSTIEAKLDSLTGAFLWKGKFDTLPPVDDYEAGNVVGVGKKEYVLTVTEGTKAWEEFGDEDSYLLKTTAEETYAKKTSIPTVNDPKITIKMNGAEKGSFTLNQAAAGEVDLGTVVTSHQDISGKVDKTALLNTLAVVDLSSSDAAVRKVALDDFKTKWLALGNTDLNGARFIGRFTDANGSTSISESGKALAGEDTLLVYRQISPGFPQGFYGLSYIKDMANTLCGLYQIYVDYDTTDNPGNIEITQIRDSETFDLLNRFVYGEVPSTYLKITDAESTYLKKADGEVKTANLANGAVTSAKLSKGVRNTIVITKDTKTIPDGLLDQLSSQSHTVDAVFRGESSMASHWGDIYPLYNIANKGSTYELIFAQPLSLTRKSYMSGSPDTISYTCYKVNISGGSILIEGPYTDTLEDYMSRYLRLKGYPDKSSLSPVLREIDLTGTDADRKAKLDKFETDWKALTGATDLAGARFVGRVPISGIGKSCLFTYQTTGGFRYAGFVYSVDSDDNVTPIKVALETDAEGVYVNYSKLVDYSHLEAITIYTDNTPEHMQANLNNIAAYKANLELLGVDTTNGYSFLANLGGYVVVMSTVTPGTNPNRWFGMLVADSGHYKELINSEGRYIEEIYNYVDKYRNAKSLEAITIKTGNTPNDKTANVAAIKAYVDNLKALGVDTTKGYMIPCKFPNSVAGVLSAVSNSLIVAITTNGRGELNCYEVYIGGDNPGAVYSIGGFQLRISSNLTTTEKSIVPAINEVNALAKSKQDALTSGTNIKTVNGQSLLGSGDIAISGGGGDVTAAGDNTFTGNNVFSGIAIADILDGTQYQITGDNGVLMFTSGATNEDIEISGVATPTYSNSAANKSYVDTQINTALGTVLTQLQNI